MKRILCMTLATLLLLSAALLLPSCAGKGKRTADYVKGDEVVIDNETPYVYDPAQNTVFEIEDSYGYTWEYDVLDRAEDLCDPLDDKTYTYDAVSKYYGNKIVRELKTEE